jgi:hypothetical protein
MGLCSSMIMFPVTSCLNNVIFVPLPVLPWSYRILWKNIILYTLVNKSCSGEEVPNTIQNISVLVTDLFGNNYFVLKLMGHVRKVHWRF